MKDGLVAAVSDFGMARMKENKEDSFKTTSEIGPLKWMAPGYFDSLFVLILK